MNYYNSLIWALQTEADKIHHMITVKELDPVEAWLLCKAHAKFIDTSSYTGSTYFIMQDDTVLEYTRVQYKVSNEYGRQFQLVH